jgi:lactoylglutathione lyase
MPKFIHTMIRVENLARSAAFYGQVFGLAESHRLEFPTFTLLYLREPESGAEIELTLNHGRTERYTHGSAFGHLAFCVDDLEAHRKLVQGLGYESTDIKELPAPAARARFYFTTDPDGYKIEVLQRAGHYV